MTQPNTATDPQHPRVVVDSDALDIVQGAMSELSVASHAEQTHPELKLTRLTVELDPDESVDSLLAEVRRRIAERHGGWTPVMGKDRDASAPIATGGHSRIMSFGPVAAGTHGGHSRIMGLGAPSPSGGQPKIMGLVSHEHGTGTAGLNEVGFDALTVDAEASDAFLPPVGGGVKIGWVDTPLADLTVAEGETAEAWRGHSAFVRDLIRQVAPNAAEPILRDVLNQTGGRGTLWDVAVAMVDLVRHEHVDILLLPLATYTVDGLPPLLLSRTLEVIAGECLIIAAAGNQLAQNQWKHDRCWTSSAWPAAFPHVRAVGAIFEDAPPQLPPWMDAVTPGATFEARFFNGPVLVGDNTEATGFSGTASWVGTSFSAAHAAGLVAARMSATGATPTEAWESLLLDGERQLLSRAGSS